jgi:hypothetical protein
MRDVQVSIANYYDATAGFCSTEEPFETQARSALSFIQRLNDLLRRQIGQATKFRTIFQAHLAAGSPDAELIEGFRYARNVASHLLFPVTPETSSVVGGLGIGYLTSACWQPIPQRAHNRLETHTRALKPFYDRRVSGRLVMDTLLDAAKYFATLSPECVHRDARGEWTGFPLRSQPGIGARLHPLEPQLDFANARSVARNRRWLATRPPGGDLRLVCGRDFDGDRDVIFGLTFRGQFSFSPFVDTTRQVSDDLARGYRYYRALDPSRLEHVELGPYRHGGYIGAVRYRRAFPELIQAPLTDIAEVERSHAFLSAGEWSHQIRVDGADPLVRRAQRLAAVFPPT